jgi:hypothetical protein
MKGDDICRQISMRSDLGPVCLLHSQFSISDMLI